MCLLALIPFDIGDMIHRGPVGNKPPVQDGKFSQLAETRQSGKIPNAVHKQRQAPQFGHTREKICILRMGEAVPLAINGQILEIGQRGQSVQVCTCLLYTSRCV